MKIRSLKSNFILNALRVMSSALIGIGMMPYVNRIVGVTVIGHVEYVLSIVNYFVLFSALGIPIYGIREIARVRDDLKERTKVFIELFAILLITTFISYAILFGIILHLHFFSSYKALIILLGALIFLTNIGTEWYFQGMENQLYITIRTIAVRIIGFLLIIFLVKSPDDEFAYAAIMLFILGGANLLNMLYVFRTLDFKLSVLNQLNLKRHLKPICTVFFAAVSINIYLHLDKILLGTMKGANSVAYYVVANKIIRFVIEFITIIGMVMLPRLSKLFLTDVEQYKRYILKAFYVIILIALPFSIYLSLFAKEIIGIMAGPSFTPSIIAMHVLSPLCFVVGIAYYLGYLILYTQNKEKIYTTAVVVSALFSIVVNYFAIHRFDFIGAAVVAVISEIIAILIMLVLMGKAVVTVNIWTSNFFKIGIANVLLLMVSLAYRYLDIKFSDFYWFIISTALFFGFYLIILLIFNEDTVEENTRLLKQRLGLGK